MSKILGVDWGKKSVGLAISEGILASPFDNLAITSLKDGISRLENIIKKEGIEKVVIGIPESGEAKSMSEKALKEIKKLDVEVIGADETLTTQKAQEISNEFDLKGEDHKLAAALILQEYLDYARS